MLKYQQIKQKIAARINELKAGEALPPVRQMLAEFHCSQATLKRALDALESQGVIFCKPGSGVFVMEQQLDYGAIGIISSNMTTRMTIQILSGIQEAIGEKSCKIILLPSRNVNLEQLFLMVRRSLVFGTIIHLTTMDLLDPDFLALIRKLASAGIRMVGVDLPLPGVSGGFVMMNNQAVFANLGALLRQRGVRKVAFVGRFPSKVYAVRLRGFCEGFSDTNNIVQFDSNNVSKIAEISSMITPDDFNAVVLADANTSIPITYELRCLYGERLCSILISGIVEEGDVLPWRDAWSLEKPNSRIGREAVKLLLNSASPSQFSSVNIKIKQGHLYDG